jgi:phosphonate metabolism protein (transferase hexapeptide repeat family)
MRLGPEPFIDPTARVENSRLGAWTSVAAGVRLEEVVLGDYSYLMERCQANYATIGKFCSIASDVRLNPGNHPMDRPTQHHMTYRARMYGFAAADDDAFFAWRRDDAVTIGHDVWIGHGAVILPGVSIGNGAVVGAGAVVSRDVGSYTIVAGVPARTLRRRFSEDIAARIEATLWWDWSRAELAARFADLRDLETFLRVHAP